MAPSRLLVAGNWKMNGSTASLTEIAALKSGAEPFPDVSIWVFPPATLLRDAAALVRGSPILIGAQDCHNEPSGAYTGDLSAPMLKDAGAAAVIAGHSERRDGHHETSAMVKAKAAAAIGAGLQAIICVGESAGEREAGLTAPVCTRQLKASLPPEASPANAVIAYEPVWAIGSGLSPSTENITDMHRLLRAQLCGLASEAGWRIIYGGSVTPANAAGIFASREVDGVLVGGASLKASSFLAIVAAANEAQDRR